MSDRRWLVTALLAASVVAGCGSGSDGSPTAASRASAPASKPRPDLCRVGGPALAAIPGAPGWWQESKRAPVILGCPEGGGSGGAALVGYVVGRDACVASYRFQTREVLDERCTEPGTSWTIQCEGRLGCTSAFMHEPGLTQLNGPVDARVKRVEVSVGGKRLESGVMFVAVKGRLARAIGAREPFGFFYVEIPRCVRPAAVRIELLAADGSRLGTAQRWDVIVDKCPETTRQGEPSA